jgi:hypothetical protein
VAFLSQLSCARLLRRISTTSNPSCHARILQVRIDNHDDIAIGVVQAGAHCDFLAEITREIDERDARVGLPQRE